MTNNIIAQNEPKAKQIPFEMHHHGDLRVDNYYWLNQRENPEVIAYLEEENAYYKQQTAHTKDFQETLFQEIKARIKEDDESVPYFYNGYWYITRFETGKGYPIYARKKGSLNAPEEILFDCNELAKGYAYFKLTGINISDDNRYCAFGVDTVSRREYTIKVKDLQTGELLDTEITNTTGGSTWAADGKSLFYSRKDKQTLRPFQIFRHTVGIDAKHDVLVFEEKDDTFGTFIYRSKSKKYLIIGSESTLTTEYQILEADNPTGDFRIFQKRTKGLEYSISHYGNQFFIVTNKDKAENFKIMTTAENETAASFWKEFIPHRKETLIEGIDIFDKFLVVSERTNGLNQIWIKPWEGDGYYLPFDSETYTAYTTTNIDFDTTTLRYAYQSMATPASVIDFDMVTKERTVKKVQEVLGDFSVENYEEKRVWAIAEDGVKIPISLVYKKGLQLNGENPVLLYGYGSYGASMEPYFSSTRLSLLDRGFVFAIAHIRGGEDLGRQWYEMGKLLQKRNTFTDFIACSEYLINEKYTSPNHLYAEGGSAGGLLMGSVINMRPELYHGVIAQVPFVDVVTTMLDDTIPLTTGEYDEWGNPNDKQYYDYMKSYSPYDNVVAQDYPHLYVSTGFHDSQVQYWEPAKWVAKIRSLRTNNNQLYLDTNMDTGHGSSSDRFEALREVAKEYSFLLHLAGKVR
ncbi:S9 family peptidase [Capnocytophaga sp. ARDL2]|uniref:S9 family peptidase n=1 Tax=Capnocytophaga sp. ARDL2 TaxID=3238809 RepID=UPI00355642B1